MSPIGANVLGFAAFSGTGKTTLLKQLIPLLKQKGLRVGLIKKTHHDIAIDQPGKDSHALRLAGASPVMLSSPRRRAIVTEHEEPSERTLAEELAFFDVSAVDLILVEGFKRERFAKIELHRHALGRPLLFPEDDSIIAIATDGPLPVTPNIPRFDLNTPQPIADFIAGRLQRHASQP
jgi:molybdopterin-guanine dinucleotide biosynthesis protein B